MRSDRSLTYLLMTALPVLVRGLRETLDLRRSLATFSPKWMFRAKRIRNIFPSCMRSCKLASLVAVRKKFLLMAAEVFARCFLSVLRCSFEAKTLAVGSRLLVEAFVFVSLSSQEAG